MPKVLYVCHNHPANRPGGAEIYALELYEAVRRAGRFEPTLVARAGPPVTTMESRHSGTRFALHGEDPDVYLMYTDRSEIDLFWGTAPDKQIYTRDWRRFLEAIRPDVVHFQHTLLVGYDLVRQTRNVLPRAPIVFTLHEFLPICHHSGQMVRTKTLELCDRASPPRCHQCFPKTSADTFFLRERYIKAALEPVDLFVAPSLTVRERYVQWGLPVEKILVEDYGRLPVRAVPDPPDAGRRRRIGFFGQITRFKGADVLLEAIKLLRDERVDVELWLCGANLKAQAPAFQKKVAALLTETADRVHYRPGYDQSQLPLLMSTVDWVVVPSIWWENSPLVIQEAHMNHRPVIASGVGGMAEKIRAEIDGLHVVPGDVFSLAEAIKRAVTEPGLWDRLRARIDGVHPMDAHVATMTGVYEDLLARVARDRVGA